MSSLDEEGKKETIQPQTVTLYTEVSPEKADELERGQLVSAGEARSNLIRWISEIVLEETEPEKLKALGIARMKQPIFATPVPYQGKEPMAGKIPLAFDTDPSLVYIAEGDHLTAMRQFGVVDLGILKQLQQMIGKSTGVTQKEFLPHYESLPGELKTKLQLDLTPLATDYWNSAVPSGDYAKLDKPYFEPETLLLPKATIGNLRRL